MGRKSREKRDRVKEELPIKLKWYQSEWFCIIVIGVVFYGGIIWTNEWSVRRGERLEREGRNAYQMQREANKRYVENLFK